MHRGEAARAVAEAGFRRRRDNAKRPDEVWKKCWMNSAEPRMGAEVKEADFAESTWARGGADAGVFPELGAEGMRPADS